jgi:hypothetical protein
MLKSISHDISARVAPYQPEGWYGARGLICHAIWIIACVILFIIYYQAKVKTKFLSIWQQICLSWRTFSLWRHWYAFLHGCWYWYIFFARRADMGDCDVANITPCKFCIITTKYMIKRNMFYDLFRRYILWCLIILWRLNIYVTWPLQIVFYGIAMLRNDSFYLYTFQNNAVTCMYIKFCVVS